MTARKIVVLACDGDGGCSEIVKATDFESLPQLRQRATRENGWRVVPSFTQGGHTDLCRWHA